MRINSKKTIAAIAVMTAMTTADCAMMGVGGGRKAQAYLRDANGVEIAHATLHQNSDNSVTLEVITTAVPVGTHGIHFHALSQCRGDGFSAAGGHYNVAARKHGLSNPDGAHNGDLPNLVVDQSGRVTYRATTNRVTLTPGPMSLFDADGSAIIIHAGADDQLTDPAGNSGARIACGIVQPD